MVSFAESTRVFIANQKELSEYSSESGVNLDVSTIYADLVLGKFIMQTTFGMALWQQLRIK